MKTPAKRSRFETWAVLALFALGLALTHLYIILYTPAARDGYHPRIINVPRGAIFRLIAEDLRSEGIIRDTDRFLFAARLMGAYKKTKAGEYELSPSMAPVEIIRMFMEGKVKGYKITVPEGYSVREIAYALGAAGLADPEEFLSMAKDPGFTEDMGFDGASLEGYLFPDTYQFKKGMSAEDIILKMIERFNSVYYMEFDRLAKNKGITMKEAITLASIIEKETGAPEERPIISAVFHNRLKKGIRLQSDPTVIYALNVFDGKITKKHLLTKNPYNTYVNYGLPPGPIANPGRDAIKAALEPANEDYIYFVSKNDGTHQFSRSLQEHNEAVNMYQRQIKETHPPPVEIMAQPVPNT